MVKLNRIYTKTGDQGQTGLGDGSRVDKDALRVEAYGTVDEANAALGIARLCATGPENAPWDGMLFRIQNDLFDLGADLCVPEKEGEEGPHLRIQESQVERLEHEIDAMNEALAPLNSFVLPGGTALAAELHLARTIVRRAERLMVSLAKHELVGAPALRYINRLSDHLFVMSRAANKGDDVLWVPGKNRD
ncbi:cob(I)alamin adenosyltransferase [Rhizomicrobium palustre]|uniref:Corrinoid adenosyltransferase n=1 Tax=Rhizomicrobium palustre TaxID=189966 RepID=A0A846MZ91_9PROT|nr:cob(I)yrinic acid a,c-diamide adenosyltransferase [Rhizomicrobium palustre]NIK88257.1 cob(I)alamin adenosyltransferase [Rhizomicrobium palustre]